MYGRRNININWHIIIIRILMEGASIRDGK